MKNDLFRDCDGDAFVRHAGLYRAKLSCRIGRDALDGKSQPPEFVTPAEYAIYNMLHAIEEIADALLPNGRDEPNTGS
jgi:hypothetical protein